MYMIIYWSREDYSKTRPIAYPKYFQSDLSFNTLEIYPSIKMMINNIWLLNKIQL